MYKSFIQAVLLIFVASITHGQDTIVHFIKDNPDKSSIYFRYNGKILVDINSDRAMPLASTVKIIVAIEYAEQAAAGTINPNTLIDTSDINRYYIPNTDGGAQPGWTNLMTSQNLFVDGKVSLEEVVKGMINFSSNANTEYLIDLLGLDNVNMRTETLGLKSHTPLYYFISALKVINDHSKEELENMSLDEYVSAANSNHTMLKNDRNIVNTITALTIDKQYIWSNRLPAASTHDYASIMQKINGREYFSPEAQKNIDIVMEGILQNPANRKWLKHAGMKGGSTMWILTKVMYATKTDDETVELAYFFNDLSLTEQLKLQKDMNKFELAILSNKEGARDRITELLNSK
ncbi:MAG: serine hydrolase [Chitinophagales bacterium]|nr:serine hydrolase [Chitinophagaceae bacterium]MCB9064824.1 serine hydrolase [Chitinophagales bacterium]